MQGPGAGCAGVGFVTALQAKNARPLPAAAVAPIDRAAGLRPAWIRMETARRRPVPARRVATRWSLPPVK